jgi:hypothetical protein
MSVGIVLSENDNIVKGLRPRPGFSMAPGQQDQGPLALDEKRKIQVPAAINTYLRDYQREGVKFFWNQYQAGRGGLLGDDMGLVSLTQFPFIYIAFLMAVHSMRLFRVSWGGMVVYKKSNAHFYFVLIGKTIQVISFLSAIMRKRGVITDKHRRRKHISNLQDLDAWRERRHLPPANSTWPTCLIIAPSTVVHNWGRELETVR